MSRYLKALPIRLQAPTYHEISLLVVRLQIIIGFNRIKKPGESLGPSASFDHVTVHTSFQVEFPTPHGLNLNVRSVTVNATSSLAAKKTCEFGFAHYVIV